MRISPFMIFNQLASSMKDSLKIYAQLNEQLASGKKINRPSDDPMGMARSLDYRLNISSNDQYKKNIDAGAIRLNITEVNLDSASATLANIQHTISLSLNSSADQAARDGYSTAIAQNRNDLFSFANATFNNQYLFSGFRTDQQAYTAGPAYAYQGDAGVMNVRIDQNMAVPVNVRGDEAFSLTMIAPEVRQISGGKFVHYTPQAGTTTIDVEIRDTNDTTVLDTFSFSNAMQMTDQLSSAIKTNDSDRVRALSVMFDRMSSQVHSVQAEVGTRLSLLSDQSQRLQSLTSNITQALETTENANPVEITAGLKTVDVTLQALRESASRVLSQSLMDFLK